MSDTYLRAHKLAHGGLTTHDEIADFRRAMQALIHISSRENSQLGELLCATDTEGWSALHLATLGALLPLVLALFEPDVDAQSLFELRSQVLSSAPTRVQIEPHVMEKILSRLRRVLQLRGERDQAFSYPHSSFCYRNGIYINIGTTALSVYFIYFAIFTFQTG